MFTAGFIFWAIITLLASVEETYEDDRWERRQEEERREREHMKMLAKLDRLERKAKKDRRRKVTRTYARDEKGRFIAQETVEEE